MLTVIGTSNDFETEYYICLITNDKKNNKKKWLLKTATQFRLTFLTPTIDKEPIFIEKAVKTASKLFIFSDCLNK